MQAGISGTTYEGGCPFKNFDVDTLGDLLRASLTEDETGKFIGKISRQSPEILCTAFLKLTCKNNTDNIVVNSPVQFYQRMVD